MDYCKKYALSIKYSINIKETCDEWLKNNNLSYFFYSRTYPDGSCVSLTNNIAWQEHAYSNFLYLNVNKIHAEQSMFNANLYLMDYACPTFAAQAKEFGIFNYLTSIKQCGDYVETLDFGSAIQNSAVVELYMNKQNVLENFTQYFISKSLEILKAYKKSPIVLESDFWNKCENKNMFEITDNLDIPLSMEYGKAFFSLTDQERLVAKYLSKGYTAKYIAKLLNHTLSFRTIQEYSQIIMRKFGVSSKNELLTILHKHTE